MKGRIIQRTCCRAASASIVITSAWIAFTVRATVANSIGTCSGRHASITSWTGQLCTICIGRCCGRDTRTWSRRITKGIGPTLPVTIAFKYARAVLAISLNHAVVALHIARTWLWMCNSKQQAHQERSGDAWHELFYILQGEYHFLFFSIGFPPKQHSYLFNADASNLDVYVSL